ncbi:MAG: nucleotide sugar dehydrogenase [Nitrospirae bacterium]|nr:nucleotide sugar dehydrogenase [Nitrospirota bacterium]
MGRRMENRSKQLIGKILDKRAQVAIIGMGYVGLPLAVEFARVGFKVTGLDIDAEKIRALQAGDSYIPDIPSTAVRSLVKEGRFYPTTDPEILKTMDTVTICVPTPLRKTKDPDLSYIMNSVEVIRRSLHPGQLIILESTTYPGTTDEMVLPMLEETGLKVGRDFFLAFSPERVDPGNKQYTTRNTPKVVGGITAECTQMARTLYEQAIEKVISVSSTKVAETVKLLENTFRSVNIALVNEIALMSYKLGINVWEVIDAAATKPFGFLPFYPGPGIGGHCIPIDPFYLSWKARQTGFEARFIDLAGQINSRMPEYVVEKVMEALNQHGKCLKGARLLIVGVAYKKDINDVRESPALDIISLLARRGAQISYHDPFVPSLPIEGIEQRSKKLDEKTLEEQDCVVIVTNHSGLDYEKIVKTSRLIMDTRNALKGFNGSHIVRL